MRRTPLFLLVVPNNGSSEETPKSNEFVSIGLLGNLAKLVFFQSCRLRIDSRIVSSPEPILEGSVLL